MPTHNGAAFVGETIESILGQTYERLELVVVDDASSDGTPEIVASYAERNPGPDRARPRRRAARPLPAPERRDRPLERRADRLDRPGRPLAAGQDRAPGGAVAGTPGGRARLLGVRGLRLGDRRDDPVARPKLRGGRRRARAAVRAGLLRRVADGALPPRGADPSGHAPARDRLLLRRRPLPLARALARLAGRAHRRRARALPAPRRRTRARAWPSTNFHETRHCAAAGVPGQPSPRPARGSASSGAVASPSSTSSPRASSAHRAGAAAPQGHFARRNRAGARAHAHCAALRPPAQT